MNQGCEVSRWRLKIILVYGEVLRFEERFAMLAATFLLGRLNH